MLPCFRRPVRLQVLGVEGLESMVPLLDLERAEFAAVLGQPIQLSRPTRETEHTWRLQLDPETPAPQLEALPAGPALVSRAGRPEDFSLTLQLLHTLARSPDTTLAYEEVSDYEQVLDRIDEEVTHTYPYGRLRGLGPEEFRSCRPEATASGQPWVSEQFWSAVQRWVAALGDAHTAVIGPGGSSSSLQASDDRRRRPSAQRPRGLCRIHGGSTRGVDRGLR